MVIYDCEIEPLLIFSGMQRNPALSPQSTQELEPVCSQSPDRTDTSFASSESDDEVRRYWLMAMSPQSTQELEPVCSQSPDGTDTSFASSESDDEVRKYWLVVGQG